MRKAMCVIVMCLLVCASMAWADDATRTAVPAVGVAHAAPNLRADCSLSYFDWNDPNIDWSYWSCWDVNEGFKQWYGEGDVYPGTTCETPFYPFQVEAITIYLYTRPSCTATTPATVDTEIVGHTLTFQVDIECPRDVTSPGIERPCKGPGDVVAVQTYQYTFTQEDWDNYAVALTLPISACMDAKFFASYKNIAWDGPYPQRVPSPLWRFLETGPAEDFCHVWSFIQLGTQDRCWFSNDYDFGCGAGCWPGDYLMIIDGQTNVQCTPVVCDPCPRTLVGETAADPIKVRGTDWSQTIDLRDYCSDYVQGAFFTGGSLNGAAGDVVLKIEFPDPNEFYEFVLTITPQCSPTTIPFRIRSWMTYNDAYYYSGNPQFPTFLQAQVYQMNDLTGGYGSVQGGVYLLYIDGRSWCNCPVLVTYTGDLSLPVELTAFDVLAGDHSANVTWATASESDNDHFSITRDGAEIARVAANNGPTGHNYTWTDDGLDNGVTYSYTLSSVSLSGEVKTLGTKSVTPSFDAAVVTDYALHQNFPNPFNPTTAIAFDLKDAGFVSLSVFNLMGQAVGTAVKGDMAAGRHVVNFDGSNLPSGVYLYTLDVNGYSASKKMVLMK